MVRIYGNLAIWSNRHVKMLSAVALAAIPGSSVTALGLNAIFGRSHASFAWIFLCSLPLGIWATGALLTIPVFGPGGWSRVRLVQAVMATAITVWMLSPIGIVWVLLS